MANFEPLWSLKTNDTILNADQTTTIEVRMSSYRPEIPSDEYQILDTQHMEFNLTIKGYGSTLTEKDFKIEVSEPNESPVEIQHYDSGNNNQYGVHLIKLKTKKITLEEHQDGKYSPVFIITLTRPFTGIWDSGTSISFEISEPRLLTVIQDQVSGNASAGVLDESHYKVHVKYNNTKEVWVTPYVQLGNKPYTIGSIGYGSDSRLFAQAFGKSRKFDPKKDNPNDESSRVFVPVYEMIEIDETELSQFTDVTNARTTLIPNPLDVDLIEERRVSIKDTNGNYVNSGLRFNANGQLLQTFLYRSEPVDVYFKLKITSLKSLYKEQHDAYYVGKRFKAYQMWIAPDDVSNFDVAPTPGHLYMLKDTKIYPYTVKEISVADGTKLVYDETVWIDLGVYDDNLGSGIIGDERIFRFLANNQSETDIIFETDENLGIIHVGEYFGHSVYPVIKANGDALITYTIDDSSRDNLEKYNLYLSPSGEICGTAYARGGDFNINDEINLSFIVVATGRSGISSKKEYKLTIVRGFGENYLSAFVAVSVSLERKWFSAISSQVFDGAKYYRPSDVRYGLQKVPRILLKENLVDPTLDYIDLKTTKRNLRNNIISSSVPTSSFKLVMGNYKIRSALDNNGNVIYDVIYREVFPYGLTVQQESNAKLYNTTTPIIELYGLRENIVKTVGEDIQNLLVDPDDAANRAVDVLEISGISRKMTDTVPRHMAHPYELQPGYVIIIPVAYLEPGTAESFYLKLTQSGEHKTLVNEEFIVQGVEFEYFVKEYGKYIKDKFIITIPSEKLL